jgi:hypothetical protein
MYFYVSEEYDRSMNTAETLAKALKLMLLKGDLRKLSDDSAVEYDENANSVYEMILKNVDDIFQR